MPHTKAALTIVATLVLTLPACTSGPRLSDRNAAEEPSEAILRLARQREEARRLARQAEQAEKNDAAKAIELYREALALDDSMQQAWNNLGTLLMDLGMYADAVGAFQRASQLVPGDPRPEYNIGVAYQRNGWGEDAYRHFAAALERDPSHLPSIRGFVRAAEMTGKADERLLEVIERATLRETDRRWHDYFLRQRYRVEAVMQRSELSMG